MKSSMGAGLLAALLLAALNGCVSYRPAPLDLQAPLAGSLAALRQPAPVRDDATSFTARRIAALAVFNNPDLVAARAQHGVAEAQLLNAGLLPDPVVTAGFGALLSGPADAPAISGSLAYDLSALITYSVDRQAARAGLAQVDAGILWQEWQVAGQAEQLCVSLDVDRRIVMTLQADRDSLNAIETSTANAVAAGNLTIAAASASLAALAATDSALNIVVLARQQDQDQLDALLGLQPGVTLPAIAPPAPVVDPATARAAIATLADRRPDLIALRYGYADADAKLRAAILSQFLPISVGVSGGRDTTKVVSAGLDVSLVLPFFNRNRGGIAIAAATRAQLAAQFSASLATAVAGAEALQRRIALLQRQSAAADQSASLARQVSAEAARAFAAGEIDALSAVNLQTAASDRVREAITLDGELTVARLSLITMLGLGLPTIDLPGDRTAR